jgi:hypothetical protein
MSLTNDKKSRLPTKVSNKKSGTGKQKKTFKNNLQHNISYQK